MDLNVLTNDNKLHSVPIGTINAINNEEEVRRIVNKNDNPNPVIILCFGAIILVLIYYIYCTMIKQCFNGEWYSTEEELFILHNKWNDSIEVYVNFKNPDERSVTYGYVAGNAIYIKHNDGFHMGVYKDKKIYWVNSIDVWQRPMVSTE